MHMHMPLVHCHAEAQPENPSPCQWQPQGSQKTPTRWHTMIPLNLVSAHNTLAIWSTIAAQQQIVPHKLLTLEARELKVVT